MLSSRGCSHTCDFCSIVAWHKLTGGARVRLRSVETVADEMAALHECGYRIFNFHDDNFLFQRRDQNLKRLRALHGALRQREIGRVALAIKSRPDSVDGDVFELLRELGVFRVFVGIEAGTDASLRQLGRNQTVADNDRALAILEDLDFHTCFNILLLNPDSTLDDFAANARYLKHHAQHPLNFCRTEVYAGTPLEKRLRNAGQLRGDYWGYGYTIADAQAQRAFELMHRLMFDRHHGANNVHHLTMRLDYERKLLGHFFRCPEPLDTRVRQFITEVNEQSAEYLLEIADLARCLDTTSPSQDARQQVFREEIREVTDRQMREGQLLLQSIRLAATAHAQRDPRNRRAAIGVAATLAVLTGATAHELVVPTTAQAFDMISAVPVGQVSTNQPSFDDQQATNMYSMAIAGILAQQLAPLRNVDVEMVFDDKGALAEVLLFESPRPKPTRLTDTQQTAAQKLVQQLGAESFQEREDATRQLRELGPGILPLLRETAARAQDPEVVHRSQQLINALDPRIAEPPNSNLAAYCRSLLPPRPSFTNKRLNFTVTKKAMEQFKFPTHICEMAPAPLD
jgi:radical SAM superfamily enzyme